MSTIDRVLAMVNEVHGSGIRAQDVAKGLGLDPEHACTALSKLTRRGLIERRGRGLYGPAQPATAPRLWAFFDQSGRLLTATDYERGLAGTEHALSFQHVGPFIRAEYVRAR